MIVTTIIDALKADTELVAMLATWQETPAIFPDEAPENCEGPFIIVRVAETGTETPEMQNLSINIDFCDYGPSWTEARQAAKRIAFLLDREELSCEEYESVRLYKENLSPVQHDDPRDIHYNCQFFGRATRDEWVSGSIT